MSLIDNIQIVTTEVTLSPDDVASELQSIYNKSPFTVTFSGEDMPRTLGQYILISGEIILYMQHFTDNNELMKTAIHELAHHIDYVKHGRREKPHTGSFKSILVYAESVAVEKGILIIRNTSKLLNVQKKACDFGKAIIEYLKEDNGVMHKMDNLQKMLYGASKVSIKHYVRVFNTVNKEGR
jgi:predicted SprT family Zn-dependent metalloprotease